MNHSHEVPDGPVPHDHPIVGVRYHNRSRTWRISVIEPSGVHYMLITIDNDERWGVGQVRPIYPEPIVGQDVP